MATQYDAIGARYAGMQHLPGASLERPSIQALLGPITGLKCLDLACGLGRWTSFLLENDAASVIGVDISSSMVSAANETRATWPSSWQERSAFHVGDCSKMAEVEGGPFDVVLAVWFLNYASNAEELEGMWRNVHANLRPGGRFIGLTTNPHLSDAQPFEGYGIAYEPIERVADGWKARLTARLEPQDVSFEMYQLRIEAYEKGAREAGMEGLGWHGHTLPEDGRRGTGFWEAYEARPHMKICTARRPL